MGYSYFPGHMKKTLNNLPAILKMVDIVIEVVDARAPNSCRNLDLNEQFKHKKHLVVISKSDLCEKIDYSSYFENFILLDKSSSLSPLKKKIESMLREKINKDRQKGLINTSIRAIIVGIPNVGKSTLINRFAKKRKMNVENRPGVTKDFAFLRIDNNFELLDSPGLLWPKIEDDATAYKMMLIGSLKLDKEEECLYFLLNYLSKYYPQILKNYYSVDYLEFEQFLTDISVIRKTLTREATIKLILQDFINNRIGKVYLDYE